MAKAFDLKPLYAVVEIADRGSFAAAAEQLEVSISTISLQISSLERQLNKTLFDRSTRPPSITAAGRTFVHQAKALLAQWETLHGANDRNSLTGDLKIGAVHTVVSRMLAAALLELRHQAPHVASRLVTGLTNDLVDQVSRHNLDCALVTVPDYLPANIECFPVTRQPLVVIAHQQASGRSAKQLLENNPYLRFSPDAQVARIVEKFLQDRGIKVTSSMQIDTLEAVQALVGHGLGVSVVPHFSSAADLPNHVSVRSFAQPAAYREIGLVVNKNTSTIVEIELLLSILKTQQQV